MLGIVLITGVVRMKMPWGFSDIFGPGGVAHPDTVRANRDARLSFAHLTRINSQYLIPYYSIGVDFYP